MRLLALLLLAAASPASVHAAERQPFDAPPFVDETATVLAPAPAAAAPARHLPDTVLAKVASGAAIAPGLGRRVVVMPPQAVSPFDRVTTVDQRVGISEIRGEAASLPLTGLTFMPNGGIDITISQVGGPSR